MTGSHFSIGEGCGCCPETQCRVVVDPGTRTIAIETAVCEDRCDCDACNAPQGGCVAFPRYRGSRLGGRGARPGGGTFVWASP